MSRNAEQWMQHPKFPQSHFVDSAHLHRRGDLSRGAAEGLQQELDHRLPRVRAARRVRLSHLHAPGGNAAHHRARRGPESARLLQRLPAPRQHAALRSRRQRASASPASFTRGRSTPRATASTSRVRSRVSEALLQGGRRPAGGACRDRLRRLRVGQSRRRRVLARGIHRRRARHARGVHVDAARGVPLSQGDRQHRTTSSGTTRTASSITTTCTTSIA